MNIRPAHEIRLGDALTVLRSMESESVQCCVTSPPYFGLRDYGTAEWGGGDAECDHKPSSTPTTRGLASSTLGGGKKSTGHQQEGFKNICKCGAVRVDNQIGLEATPSEFVAKMVEVFEEVRRVLKKDGTLWLNLGDSYAGGGGGNYNKTGISQAGEQHVTNVRNRSDWLENASLKPKDLIGIPWRVAFALQEAGWWLRQDIIWCLSGGTYVYAKTQKGVMPIMIRDLARLDPTTVQLWNGEKWTQLLGISKSKRKGDELELVLRSGERISCTPTHRFPTQRGLLDGSELRKGDVMERCRLPNTAEHPAGLPIDTAWFLGLYLAEGSISGNKRTIQITGHVKEKDRYWRVKQVAAFYGGTVTVTETGNVQNIRVYSPTLLAVVKEHISGQTAHNKGLTNKVWQRSNEWIQALLDGYLSGDGHYDAANDRWRLGFCRNYNWERDLRTLAARLGFRLVLNFTTVKNPHGEFPAFRGEIRFNISDHHNTKDPNEIVAIQKARCREVYDLGVADEPHLFALASGILTHNSKPNPMPESVTDRCTKAHEYIFLLTKSAKYFYDAEAVKEDAAYDGRKDTMMKGSAKYATAVVPGMAEHSMAARGHERWQLNDDGDRVRNKRSVWTVTTQPYSEAHFATFPPKLIEPCILAGSREGDTVLDPFNGSGTTGLVSLRHRRNYIGIELNPEYIKIAEKRLSDVQVKLF